MDSNPSTSQRWDMFSNFRMPAVQRGTGLIVSFGSKSKSLCIAVDFKSANLNTAKLFSNPGQPQ